MRIHRPMLAGNKRTLLLSLAATAVLSLVPIASHAVVFWDDELEAGNTGYSELLTNGSCGGLPSFQYDTTNKVGGAASLKMNFPGPAYHQLCGGYADRTFSQTTDLYTRYYIRLSPGFIVDPVGTKLLRHDATDPTLSHWWVMKFGSSNITVELQNYPNQGSTIQMNPNIGNGQLPTNGQWVCIETRTKLNTVGQTDGLVEAWKDGVQFMSHPGLEFRKSGQFSQFLQFNSIRMYRQDGDGSINYDRLASGNTRIGCSGSVPSNDTTPPAPPFGLFVK